MNTVNQAFIIIIAYRPRRRRRRKIPGIGRYPMGPTNRSFHLRCPFVKKYNKHILLLRHSKTMSQCVDLVGTFLVPSFYDRDLFPA